MFGIQIPSMTVVAGSTSNIKSLSLINVGGNMTLNASNNIMTSGASFDITGSTSFIAGNDITLGVANVSSSIELNSGNNEFSEAHNLAFATSLISGGNVNIDAGNNFAIIAGQNVSHVHSHAEGSGGFGKDESHTWDSLSISTVSGNISGSNVSIGTGNNILVGASNITATENLNLDAGGEVNIVASVNTEMSGESESSTGTFSSSVVMDSNSTQTITSSNLSAGGNFSINAGNNVNILGSNLSGATGNITSANGNVNILSIATVNE